MPPVDTPLAATPDRLMVTVIKTGGRRVSSSDTGGRRLHSAVAALVSSLPILRAGWQGSSIMRSIRSVRKGEIAACRRSAAPVSMRVARRLPRAGPH
jgi:hypothetical protein